MMKDLAQGFEVHQPDGAVGGSWEVSQPRLPSAPVGRTAAPLILEGLGQCYCSLEEPSSSREWLWLLSGIWGVMSVFSLSSEL